MNDSYKIYEKLWDIETTANYKAGIYLRLSREDGEKSEEKENSESIKNQRELLTAYCRQNNFPIIEEYKDDGISRDNL